MKWTFAFDVLFSFDGAAAQASRAKQISAGQSQERKKPHVREIASTQNLDYIFCTKTFAVRYALVSGSVLTRRTCTSTILPKV